MVAIKQLVGKHNVLAAIVLALMGIFLLYSVFGDDGLVDYYRLREKARTLDDTNASIGRQNLELYRVIERLSGDLTYIETMARRELGMVAPDEVIFKFEASRIPPRVVPDTRPSEENGGRTP
ncbi:MAG: septum formation initiator family protein [Desulfosarcinaceae bacterium]|nr:septum formation initiator family protein [Desulfosarcinaceae bacterium]